MANPQEDVNDEDEDRETEIGLTSTAAKSTIVDGVTDDNTDDESQRGRRHISPHWKQVRK